MRTVNDPVPTVTVPVSSVLVSGMRVAGADSSASDGCRVNSPAGFNQTRTMCASGASTRNRLPLGDWTTAWSAASPSAAAKSLLAMAPASKAAKADIRRKPRWFIDSKRLNIICWRQTLTADQWQGHLKAPLEHKSRPRIRVNLRPSGAATGPYSHLDAVAQGRQNRGQSVGFFNQSGQGCAGTVFTMGEDDPRPGGSAA